MVEPDRAGMAHRGLQHLAERFEGSHLKARGIEARKPPVLARGVERIGRRADAEMARDRFLLVPGIKAVGLHADRDVEIEPDLHTEPVGERTAGSQLPVGIPLREFDEFDLGRIRARAQPRAFGIIRLPPFFRPFPPRRVEFVPQHLKTGKARQQLAALGAKTCKILFPLGARLGLEGGKCRPQRAPFQSGDRDIIDGLALPQPRRGLCAVGKCTLRKLGKFFDVDIERVEEQPAVRRIRAAIAGLVVKQRMQRIEADTLGAQIIGELDQVFQIGEITHAPVANRADAIELNREQPAAVEIAGEGPLRRRDQRHLLSNRGGVH